MQKRPKALRIPRRCDRCGRRLTSQELRDGMALVPRGTGTVRASIGPCCLQPIDMAQMIIRASTEEYGLNVQDERLYKREIGSEDDGAWSLA